MISPCSLWLILTPRLPWADLAAPLGGGGWSSALRPNPDPKGWCPPHPPLANLYPEEDEEKKNFNLLRPFGINMSKL